MPIYQKTITISTIGNLECSIPEFQSDHFVREQTGYTEEFFVFTATSISTTGNSVITIECSDQTLDISGSNPDWTVNAAVYQVTHNTYIVPNTYVLMISYYDFMAVDDIRYLTISGSIYLANSQDHATVAIDMECDGCPLYTITYFTQLGESDTANTLYSNFVEKNVQYMDSTKRTPFDWNIYNVASRITQHLYYDSHDIVTGVTDYDDSDGFTTSPYNVISERVRIGQTQVVVNDHYRYYNPSDSTSGRIPYCKPGIYTHQDADDPHDDMPPVNIVVNTSESSTTLYFDTAPEVIGYRTFFFGDHFHNSGDTSYISTANTPYLYNEGTILPITTTEKKDYKLFYDDGDTANTAHTETIQDTCALTNEKPKLTEIYLPDSIKIIGNCAFKGNVNLEDVEFRDTSGNITSNDNLNLVAIGSYAFEGCSSLDEWNNSSIMSFPNTLKILGEGCFKNASLYDVTAITPTALEFIGPAAFENTQIDSLSIANSTSLKKIGAFAFKNSQIQHISGTTNHYEENFLIPGNPSYNGNLYVSLKAPSLVSIGKSAFKNCTTGDFTKVLIGNNIEFIGKGAFSGCTEIETLIFESGRTTPLVIRQDAFRGCSSLITINHEIPSGYFYLDPENTSSASVSTLEDYVNILVLPEHTVTVEMNAFKWCSSVEGVVIPTTLEDFSEPFGDRSDGGTGNITYLVFMGLNGNDYHLSNDSVTDGINDFGWYGSGQHNVLVEMYSTFYNYCKVNSKSLYTDFLSRNYVYIRFIDQQNNNN